MAWPVQEQFAAMTIFRPAVCSTTTRVTSATSWSVNRLSRLSP
jgi:hypothetical protein